MSAPVLSVVDYDAWRKGYMPPGEHVLIDELSYRGAKIVLSMSGGDTGFWLVVKGHKGFKGRKLFAIMEQIQMVLEELEAEEDAAKDSSPVEPSETPIDIVAEHKDPAS